MPFYLWEVIIQVSIKDPPLLYTMTHLKKKTLYGSVFVIVVILNYIKL